MSRKEDWITVKEYAEKKGITQQAVYNSIKEGRVRSRVTDGQKYVYLPPEDSEQPTQPRQSAADRAQILMIEALLQQLEAKDAQIERQQQIIDEQIKLAAEINKTIETTTKALHEVLQNEQQLQARTQYLLKEQQQAPTPAPAAADVVPPFQTEEQREQPRSLFSWLFKSRHGR